MTECANTAPDQVRSLITISLNFLKKSETGMGAELLTYTPHAHFKNE